MTTSYCSANNTLKTSQRDLVLGMGVKAIRRRVRAITLFVPDVSPELCFKQSRRSDSWDFERAVARSYVVVLFTCFSLGSEARRRSGTTRDENGRRLSKKFTFRTFRRTRSLERSVTFSCFA